MKEDDKIRELFGDFNPELSSSVNFIAAVSKELDNYALIKDRIEQKSRFNSMRCIWSAAIGFMCGMIMTFLFPYIKGVTESILSFNIWSINLDGFEIVNTVTWSVISVVTLITTFMSYAVILNFSEKFPVAAIQAGKPVRK